MRILIAGGGQSAALIAQRLIREGSEVTIVELDPARCAQLEETLDAKVVQGSAASVKTLHRAGLRDAEMLIAITDSDQVNVLACMAAKTDSNVKLKMARIRSHEFDEWSRVAEQAGLNIDLVIHPETDVVQRIMRVVHIPGVSDIIDFADGRVKLFGMNVERDSWFAGKTVIELDAAGPPRNSLIAMIFRGQQVIIPHGAQTLLPGDHIYVVATDSNLEEVLKFMGVARREMLQRVFIVGGKQIGIWVAQELENQGVHVKLIEQDPERCERIAEIVKKTVVIRGDGTDQATLEEENIDGVDAFLALTDHDEDNIIASLLARRLGARKVVALINRLNYLPMVQRLGVNTSVSMRLATVDRILQFVRKGGVLSVTTFREEEAEAIELVASGESRYIGKKLRDLKLPRDAIVGAIARTSGEVEIPRGDAKIEEGDKVIFFALESVVPELESALHHGAKEAPAAVIDFRAIGYVLGQLLAIFSVTMAVPLLYGWASGDTELAPLIFGLSLTLGSGAALISGLKKPSRELSQREGLLLTVPTWFAVSLFGALPFVWSEHFPTITDAVFESVSGFTTTGATILPDVEVLPPALQFWRCFSHWLGGLGIVLLGVAVLPLVGHGGMHLYRAEFSGATSEKLKPRITETAFALWKIYFALTALLFVLLRIAGMNDFEALCHTFSTLGTGGFSTRTASVAGFENPAIEYILIVFMLLAGISFIQQFRFWVERKPGSVLRDVETRGYLALAAAASALIALILIFHDAYGFEPALRSALFQVSAIITTTGFATDDFELWHPLPQLLLLAIMFVGGCTGSTAGGLKVSRILLLAKVVDREFKRMVERRGVFAVRLGGDVIPEATVQSLLNLIYLAFVVNFTACIVLAATGVDVLTSIAAVAASMFNIGPGLGGVGPTENYAHLPAVAKWTLSVCMIAGRLEFYTMIVILTPWFWRK